MVIKVPGVGSGDWVLRNSVKSLNFSVSRVDVSHPIPFLQRLSIFRFRLRNAEFDEIGTKVRHRKICDSEKVIFT